MKVVVLGGNGTMGARVVRLLELAGHEVVAASRSTGIDAYAGTGLADSFAGADAVVDCLNIVSMKAGVCVDFYETTARNVIRAAEDARVAHLVCVSIVNARNPEINRRMGYYRGKAAQEARYQNARIPTTIVRTTQWFELAETLIDQMRVGPIAVVPRMMSQPVAADAVARLVVSVVELGVDAPAGVELAGPEPRDLAKLARLVARNNAVVHNGGPHPRVIPVPVPGIKVLNGGLLPGIGVAKDPTLFEEWLANGRTA
ncbi:SDR family oxidoreductase [Paeniglutamicibacter sp. NPDC012692]|uniref:SDR family oxidoreductase n=1 Tax=Paeniglutamicibacter sp. NPDC012692 TaxID=3364388 RepID=UPI0036979F52